MQNWRNAACVALVSVLLIGTSMMADDAKHGHGALRETPNRLAGETSPYLLQHAYNPVDWYPWGPEAIEAAREQDKPIFLSIGYSTCYWCHVMERESFENPDVAAVLNEYFIPVKVDREERPDVDDVYMTAVQVISGHGGWPMSMWLHPDTLKPFYGGTYFPPENQGQRPGFTTVLEGLHDAWTDRREELEAVSERIGDSVQQRMTGNTQIAELQANLVDTAVSQLQATYDQENAGYGGAPKFPMPVHLDMLLETGWDRADVQASLKHTLDRMAMGGMYDQVGGGFHRYSTDAKWLVPHFEKMLYDNGMLASIYAESADRTGDGFHGAIAEEIINYTLANMVDPSGAFWSAQDAESNAKEGESYLWTPDEVQSVLVERGLGDEFEMVNRVYGLDQGTNFRDPHHPGEPPSNVLYLPDHPAALAAAEGLSVPEFHRRITAVNEVLLATRDTRDQPSTDDKVLTGWNGLMIGGMADVGRLRDEQRFLDAARRATDVIRDTMWSEDSGLKRTARGGRVADIDAFLEDYAFMIRGLLRLYRATGNPKDLAWAIDLMDQARERFWDDTEGWFDAPEGAEDLFVRGRSLYDGAVPSGTSVMLDNQRWLHELTGEDRWLDEAEATIRPMAWTLNRSPRGSGQAIAALHHLQRIAPDRFGGKAAAPPTGPVTVSVEATKSDAGVALLLTLDIKSPWHVVLPGDGSEGLMPMRIESLTAGVTADIQWPVGRRFDLPTGAFSGLQGQSTIQVDLKSTVAIPNSIDLSVTWQACDDQVCMQPVTRRLRVVLPVGSSK